MTIENINTRKDLEQVIEYAVSKAKCVQIQHRVVGYAVSSTAFYTYVGYPCHVNIVAGRIAYIVEGAYCTTYFGKNVFPYKEFEELLL